MDTLRALLAELPTCIRLAELGDSGPLQRFRVEVEKVLADVKFTASTAAQEAEVLRAQIALQTEEYNRAMVESTLRLKRAETELAEQRKVAEDNRDCANRAEAELAAAKVLINGAQLMLGVTTVDKPDFYMLQKDAVEAYLNARKS